MTSPEPINFKTHFIELFQTALDALKISENLPAIELTRTKQVSHGDYSCNLAMHLAKTMRKSPREVAQNLIDHLPASPILEKIEIAGAGFINLFIKDSAKQSYIKHILTSKERYGSCNYGQGKKVQIEFVSANPTGPLHVGHGRGAALGASLANLLKAAGYTVLREFYVNDAGRQMDILTVSTWLRYLEINQMHIPFPQNAYQGGYVKEMAQQLYDQFSKRLVQQTERILQDFPLSATEMPITTDAELDLLIANAKKILGDDYFLIHQFVLAEQIHDCRNDLQEFGVEFDEWFSEQSLFDSGLVTRTVTLLEEKNYLYTKDGAKWFRSTDFGDEKDRVVQRENGQFTYFASDIAYHLNKFERGFDLLINIWGADHHGYIARVKGALQALNLDPTKLEIALVQFAVLYQDGKKMPMSTRSGEFVTLRELRHEVGNDAARFFYAMRKSDQHLDFDLDLAKSQSNENPVYYVQYAYARICSVLAQWNGDLTTLEGVDTNTLSNPGELSLLQKLIDFPDMIEAAAKEFSPHLITFYLRELAGEFHSYYNSTRFLVDETSIMHARLALIASVRQTLSNGLKLLGVSTPVKM
ncbi:MAG TPA: arginine--tRNA ligase [Nitrosomonas sp.]|nr:arginine--tRNA ligase [Nitrosomonas sp.]HQX14229.1 arginine--tRNA ligase [Nitrosomonas sp.]HRB33058.1 arginine--tRNA ligase [Nitrosomonas sp.]HRB46299.1 arginine--tRNA ligase [Nitrosomonas sp.]HRB78145.1 arginine--tRNA ligase [Nitrosomonas sp.]